jgi:predicted membrane-bound spermidine synthase
MEQNLSPNSRNRRVFAMFFLSGFCGLLYQVVWIRMAYAAFGVISPVLSVVISVFMLGLSLGSWGGGKWIRPLVRRTRLPALFFYALAELGIGVGGLLVPFMFSVGESWLLPLETMDSARYLFLSAVILGTAILPWTVLMGATVPFMMEYLKEREKENTTGFSFLYFANVLGAMSGTLFTALVLIEVFGLSKTLAFAAVVNFSVALYALWWTRRAPAPEPVVDAGPGPAESGAAPRPLFHSGSFRIAAVLFMTGFSSMGMEVVWARAFTPVLGTRIYSFASLLAVYLFGTWTGSWIYRKNVSDNSPAPPHRLLGMLSVVALLPVVMTDPRLSPGFASALVSILPFCTVLGYLTPMLVDRYSLGNPGKAGTIYAVNIIGCIIGPLAASYLLFPLLGVKMSLVVLALPFPVGFFLFKPKKGGDAVWTVCVSSLALYFFLRSVFVHASYEEMYERAEGSEVRRDHVATVVSTGSGMKKMLIVNGVGITIMHTVTKVMAHLPLAHLDRPPRNALVICLGMGTTYRSLLSWDIQSTAVELVPSVRDALPFFFEDADSLLNHPKGRIVIDDGRRFLNRTRRRYDVITIDPPPPVETAASSLLYSEEFYSLIAAHLEEGGIVHQWFPFGEMKILNAMARSLVVSFPHVRVFGSITGWGIHFLASMQPIERIDAETLVARMPEPARRDLVEWRDGSAPVELARSILERELPPGRVLHPDPDIRITDDRPYNEYYLLRRLGAKLRRFLGRRDSGEANPAS